MSFYMIILTFFAIIALNSVFGDDINHVYTPKGYLLSHFFTVTHYLNSPLLTHLFTFSIVHVHTCLLA